VISRLQKYPKLLKITFSNSFVENFSTTRLFKTTLVLDEKKVKDGSIEATIKKDEVVGHVELVKSKGTDYGYINGTKKHLKSSRLKLLNVQIGFLLAYKQQDIHLGISGVAQLILLEDYYNYKKPVISSTEEITGFLID